MVTISPDELATIAGALTTELASVSETKRAGLLRLLSDFDECQRAEPARLGVPEILKQLVAIALAR